MFGILSQKQLIIDQMMQFSCLRACIQENVAELALQRPRLLLNTDLPKGRRYSGFGEGEG